MMDIRKLDGAVDESLAEQHIHKSDVIVYILYKIWSPVHLAELSLMTGRLGLVY